MLAAVRPYLWVITFLLGAGGGAWVMKQSRDAAVARCELAATQQRTADLEAASRAIDTVRKGEMANGERQAEINDALATDRRAIAAALAGGVREPRAPAAAAAPVNVPAPVPAPAGCERADPGRVLDQIEAEADADAAAALDLAARLRACYARARADRELINR